MEKPWIWGVAGFVAACLEATAFNFLTVTKSRAHAGQRAPIGETFGQLMTRGLPCQLTVTALKRGSSFWLWAWAYQAGVSSWLSGIAIGALEASALTPFRRVLVAQQAFSLPDSALELWRRQRGHRGLWSLWDGVWIASLRGAAGGLFYWGTVGWMMAHAAELGSFERGFLASLATTVLTNPIEVLLTALMAPYPVAVYPGSFMRGVWQAICRTLPSATVGYWLTCVLVRYASVVF